MTRAAWTSPPATPRPPSPTERQARALERIADSLDALVADALPLPEAPPRARSWWRP